MAHETAITPQMIIAIMLTTGRFRHVTHPPEDTLIFWDEALEDTVSLPVHSTLESVIRFLNRYLEKTYIEQGKRIARETMRQALGL